MLPNDQQASSVAGHAGRGLKVNGRKTLLPSLNQTKCVAGNTSAITVDLLQFDIVLFNDFAPKRSLVDHPLLQFFGG